MNKKVIVKFHIALWIAVVAISLVNLLPYIGKASLPVYITNTTLTALFNSITFYLFYFYISKGFFENKILTTVFYWIGYTVISGFIYTSITYCFYQITYPGTVPPERTYSYWISAVIYSQISYNTIFSFLGSLSRVSLVWYENQMNKKDTEKQNLSNELAMLKAQINPHFLFNTLNNIKSLTKKFPQEAVKSVDKLNGIMHYMFYESSSDTVSLESEIEHIKNYLDLERIRYKDAGFIEFKTSGNFSGINISPLIFMPFIENAFKHGEKLTPSPGIRINIEANPGSVIFKIENKTRDKNGTQNKNSGFGLSNIKRRLELLYGNRYELLIEKENKIFSVKLNLKII